MAIVTGGPACGKTSLLEAIGMLKESVGGYGPAPTPRRMLRRGATTGRIAAAWALSDEERRFCGAPASQCSTEVRIETVAARVVDATADLGSLFEHFGSEVGLGKFEYFPANRDLHATAGVASEPPMPVALEAPLRLAKPADKYGCVHGTLVEAAQDTGNRVLAELRDKGVVLGTPTTDRVAPYRAALKKLTDGIRLEGVACRQGQPRATFAHRDGHELELDDLSASQRQAVLFATTFVRLGLNDSVILIDEPERSIHPGDHADFLRRIAGLGAGNQLIVATASAGIVRAARAKQVVGLGGAG
ncbi:MAG: AAA family ATPase [Polyangiaceae bacterium]